MNDQLKNSTVNRVQISSVVNNPLSNEFNLGPKSTAMLAAAGIHTLTQLRELGAVAAYVRVKRLGGNASLNLLYALVGALESCDWRTVQRERKLGLLMMLDDYEKQNG